MKINQDLVRTIQECWNKDTSADPENWSPKNPAYGHCDITSVLIRDYYGGEILYSYVKEPNGNKTAHFYNRIDNKIIDLTKSQFDERTKITHGFPITGQFLNTRQYIMSLKNNQKRYTTLRNRVENLEKGNFSIKLKR